MSPKKTRPSAEGKGRFLRSENPTQKVADKVLTRWYVVESITYIPLVKYDTVYYVQFIVTSAYHELYLHGCFQK